MRNFKQFLESKGWFEGYPGTKDNPPGNIPWASQDPLTKADVDREKVVDPGEDSYRSSYYDLARPFGAGYRPNHIPNRADRIHKGQIKDLPAHLQKHPDIQASTRFSTIRQRKYDVDNPMTPDQINARKFP